jgi:hypothetical protein
MNINPYRTNIVQYIAELETRRLALAQLILKKHTVEMKKTSIDRLIAIQDANVTLNICMAKDENDKPRYGNELTRKSTIETTLYSSKEYMDNVRRSEKFRKRIYHISAEMMVEDTMIKKFESLERLNFAEMEAKD